MNPFELVKPEQAAKELNTSADTIRSAMEQNTLPFPLGFYVMITEVHFLYTEGYWNNLK